MVTMAMMIIKMKMIMCTNIRDASDELTSSRDLRLIYQIIDGAKLSILDDFTALKRINSCKTF